MLHIIRQQHLHVELNGTESDGLALQRRLPGLCQDVLLPALERTLDRYAPAEGSLYIERLDIDVGSMPLKRLEHDLAAAVAELLEKALREQIPADKAAADRSGTVQHKTNQQSVNEALVFFLATGQLPWSFRLPEGRSLEQTVLEVWEKAAQASGSSPVADQELRRTLAAEAARKRLTRQFTPAFLQTLLAMLAPESAVAMDKVLQVLRDGPSASAKPFERLLWESAFAKAAADGLMTAEELLSAALPFAPAEYAAEVRARHWPQAAAEQSPAGGAARQDPRHEPDQGRRKTAAAEPPSDSSTLPAEQSASSPAQERLAKAAPSSVPVVASTPLRAAHAPPDAAEGIYINNAGLILLHPFLPQFFAALGIAADKQLLQPERALCLLHFLATGQPVAPEYELMLPKVLCNIPLEEPVESDVALTAAEQDEAVSLLKAVIRHWEALRSTSPDGLRGTFFVRPGKISLRDGDWLLQVEPQTWDILLDQLPWGIGMIKLPWMDRLLHVEWN